MDKNKVYLGDCLEIMPSIPDKSIDMILTSPPYDNLRTYGGNLQWDFESIAKELYRVTKDGGVVVWIVGDASIKGSETGTSFKQALYFKEIGFNLHDTMIYYSEKPPLTHNRYEQKFEYMFVFSKGKPKTFNPILEDCAYAGSRADRPKTIKGSRSQNCAIRSRVDNTPRYTKDKKIKGNVWIYKTGGGHSSKDSIAFEHPAIFPEKLAIDHIKSWSNEGDIILDPFAGSGTTGVACQNLRRNYILIEKEPKYYEIILKRLSPFDKQVVLV